MYAVESVVATVLVNTLYYLSSVAQVYVVSL